MNPSYRGTTLKGIRPYPRRPCRRPPVALYASLPMTEAPSARLDDAIHRLRDLTSGRHLTGMAHDQADDREGTVATDGAVAFDPWPLLRAFHRQGAMVVVMGQVAGIMHGSKELTGDLDLLWTGEAADRSAVSGAFADVGATLLGSDNQQTMPGDPLACPKAYFRTATADGDLCTPDLPWGDLDVAAFIERADTTIAPCGTLIRFVSIADLILMRRAVHREKDVRRASELERLSSTR